jgi:hypothetical protein
MPADRDDTHDRDENRATGPTIDLERLEEHARDLYLHRFVAYIKKARGEHGRYLQLRPGDKLAIEAADDASAKLLEDVVVDPGTLTQE